MLFLSKAQSDIFDASLMYGLDDIVREIIYFFELFLLLTARLKLISMSIHKKEMAVPYNLTFYLKISNPFQGNVVFFKC